MTIFTNQLRHLEKENRYTLKQITDKSNRQLVVRMVKYLSASPLPLYQVQVIRKDLIGMALEAEKEHMKLADKIGIETKQFCDEVIKSSGGSARWEHAMVSLLTVLQTSIIIYPTQWLLGFFKWTSVSVSFAYLCWLLIWVVFGVFLPEYLDRKFSIYQNKYGCFISYSCRLLALLGYVWAVCSPWGSSVFFLAGGWGWVILILFVILALTATYGMNLHWAKCAENYPH